MMLPPLPPTAMVENVDPSPETHVNPLLRLHLLLYGRYKWALMVGLLLAAGGATATWMLMPPKYQVVGYLRIKPYIAPVLSPTDQNGMLPMFETFVSLQASLLQSQRVLDQASLNPEWKALGQNSARWGTKIPADILTVEHPKNSELVTVGFTDPNLDVAAAAVKAVIQSYQATSGDTEGVSDSHRLQILEDLRTSLTNQKRGLAEQILALANAFGSDDLQRRYEFKLEEQNKLESELQQVQLAVSIAQAAAGGDPSPPSPPITAPAIRPATPAPASPPAQALAHAPAPASQPAPVAITREYVAAIDMQMRIDLADESRLALRLNQLRARLGANHREVLAAQSDLQALEDQIDARLETYRARGPSAAGPTPLASADNSKLSLPELRARETNIHALFDRVQTETKALGQQDLQIRKLKAEQDAVSHRLDETAARIDQLNLESTMSNRISVLSYGERPTAPLPGKRIPVTVAVGLLGLAAGAGLVALRGLADRRVSSLLHMQQLAPAIRVLGMLPILPEDLADPAQISLAAHCVHQIRTLLEAIPVRDQGRALAITSPSPGDGKTSLALALGLSFAASGSHTLLIDCDMVGGGLTRRLNAVAYRRLGSILQQKGLLTDAQLETALRVAGGTSRKFGEILVDLGYLSAPDIQRALTDQQETSLGLLDALRGEPIAACIASAVMEGLSILPLGAAAPGHTSQISAKALRRIITEARSQFDLIIIDTGPVLGSLEAAVASREADEVILAIARGAPSPLVTRAVELLGSMGAHLGGIVFNRATPGDVAHSKYGSSGSLRSFRSADDQNRSTPEPRRPRGAPPRLGPVASAVATAGHGSFQEASPSSPSANGAARKSPAETTANGSAQPSTPHTAPAGDGARQESKAP